MASRNLMSGARSVAACVLLVSLTISGCGGGSPGSRGSGTTTTSPSPTSRTAISPSTASPSTASPSTASPSKTSVDAQAVCASIYANRGSAPSADSGDIDDDMALFETWHAALLQRAISQLGWTEELNHLLTAMDETRRLSTRAALIYAEHPLLVSEELSKIQKRQSALADEIRPIAAAAEAPACGDLVVLP